MGDDRWVRYAPLTGLVAVVLMVVSTLLVNSYTYLKPPDEIAEFLDDNALLIQSGAYVGLASTFFLMWFAGSVRTWLREAEGGNGRLSAVAFGGGIAAGAVMLVGYGALAAAAARAGDSGGTTPDLAAALWDLSTTLVGSAAPIALAVMVGSATVVAFRTGVMARWLAWVSLLIAAGMLSPVSYIFIGFGVIWVGFVSVLLYRLEVAGAQT